ncbi:MAG: putative zinc-binding metallopeptidase [Planctomycetota bacterium]
MKTTSKSKPKKNNAWKKLPDQQLLDQRICDLGLSIEGTLIEKCLGRLYRELEKKGLSIRPHCWLSDDWFSPDGIPGIAVPFYMADPRLKRLEQKQMLEVEGGNEAWCMRIMRHEAGHAVDTAFRLHRKKKYKASFGDYFAPYPETYRPKPHSKNYVQHLEPCYAQSHPSEDFAETFAVWLNPRSGWKRNYAGWKAIKKIEYVDHLMGDLAGVKAPVRSRAKVDPVSRIKTTLREHYANRHQQYEVSGQNAFDYDLQKLFPQIAKNRRNQTAAAFLQKNRADLCRSVAQWTGEYQYNIGQLVREMIERCRELELSVAGNEKLLKQNTVVMLTVHTMNRLHGGHHRVAL